MTATVAPAVERVVLPRHFKPRSYQRPPFLAWSAGVRRFLQVIHRRGGKTEQALAFTTARMAERPGLYLHLLPSYAQAVKTIWDARNAAGLRMLDHHPSELVETVNQNELQVWWRNGALWQLAGTEHIDRLRGTNPLGVVFDEFALHRPDAWDIFRPILAENGGWAWFVGTPLGRNHFHTLYEMARVNPEWFCQRLTVDDTRRDGPGENGEPVVTPAQLDRERAEGMPEELLLQEFFVSFNAAVPGAYFSKELQRAEAEGRIDDLPMNRSWPVHTVMDLGLSDATVLLFFQINPGTSAVHVVDAYAGRGEATSHYATVLQELQRERGWSYGTHYGPHDLTQRHDAGAAIVSRLEQWRTLGVRIEVLARIPVQEGIQAARMLFPRVRFDRTRCRRLLDALAHYRSEWSEERQTLALRPVHDWSSDFADSFRYLAQAVRGVERRTHRPADPRPKANVAFDVFDSRTWGRGAGR